MKKESQRDPNEWKPHKGPFKLTKLPPIGPGSGVEQPSTKWVSKPMAPDRIKRFEELWK